MGSPLPFAAFCLVVGFLYQIWTSPLWRQTVLVAASLAFLASFSIRWQDYVPLLAFLLFCFVALKWIRSPGLFVPTIVLTVVAFIWLKQYAFVPHAWFLPFPYVTLGLSYMFFRVLHLMIAARNGALPEMPGIGSYFVYTANYLTLVTGPIQLYPDFVKGRDLSLNRRVSLAENTQALERMIKGLFKTNVLALVLSTLRQQAMDAMTDPAATPGAKLVFASVVFAAYPLFLYCNFAGFIDLVIGGGQLLGVKLPENFNRPFASESFMEFWSTRWHITLSSWLKTYVYNPMMVALMRRIQSVALEPFLGVLVFFITFFLVGVWHGQTGEMLMYGVVLGLGVSVNKLFQVLLTKKMGRKKYAALSSGPVYTAFARGLTFTYVSLTLVLFWSNWEQMRAMHTALGTGLALAMCATIFLGATVILSLWEAGHSWLAGGTENSPLFPYIRTAASAAFLVALLTISLLMNQQAPDIVYKAF